MDEQALKEVASEAKGSYFFAGDRKSLEGIYAELDRLETREVKTVSHRPRRDLFYWPILIAVLISLGEKACYLIRVHRSIKNTERPQTISVNAITGKLELGP